MQTFLPFEDFEQTAACLDYRRLGKQRVECKQILSALAGGGGWANHPAVRMWRGHAGILIKYYDVIAAEWVKRGFKHNMTLGVLTDEFATQVEKPFWLGYPMFHQSHREALMAKDKAHYSKYFNDTPRYSYLWPLNKDGTKALSFLMHEETQRLLATPLAQGSAGVTLPWDSSDSP